jgi:hypothetical protein
MISLVKLAMIILGIAIGLCISSIYRSVRDKDWDTFLESSAVGLMLCIVEGVLFMEVLYARGT